MIKKISFFISKTIIFFDNIFFKFTKKRFRYYLQDALRLTSYSRCLFENKEYKFFNPSNLTYWRSKTFLEKEPGTLRWIKNFNSLNSIFWDIGANVGLYTIFAVKNNPGIQVVSFEPSGLNLGLLEKNIYINNVQKNVKIFPIGLTNKSNSFLDMFESSEEEGGALGSLGVETGFDGKKIKTINKYKIFSTSINQLIKDKILEVPNYVKIDVDGLEHLILEEADEILNSDKLQEILIEINENYDTQFKKIIKVMEYNKFKIYEKHSSVYAQNSAFDKSYNYIFKKEI